MNGEFHYLGIYLKEKRNEQGFTQAALAKKLKVRVQFVSNWELIEPKGFICSSIAEVIAMGDEGSNIQFI